jgi:flagellar biosynthesis/type III secretory pathway M-ring protein FliF/YscJ
MSDDRVPDDPELAAEDRAAANLLAANGSAYDLDELSEGEVAALAEALAEAGVEFAFEADGDLVIAARDAERADEIVMAHFGPAAGGAAEVVYEAGDLDDDERARVTAALQQAGVSFTWQDDGDLIVSEADAAAVESVLDVERP